LIFKLKIVGKFSVQSASPSREANKKVINEQENQTFNRLLGAFLQSRHSGNLTAERNHFDEDQISAFIEGGLSERESAPFLRHLTDCGSCRKISAQLARLSIEMEDSVEVNNAPVKQSSRLQQFLQSFGLSSFGASDEAVFAHNDSSKETEAADNADENNSEKSSDK
jgi:hypothetical protein